MPEITDKSEEQKAAEAEVDGFRKHLGPFVVAAETTRMPMAFTDAKEHANPIIFANDSFLSLMGYDRKDVLGQRFNFLLARATDTEEQAKVSGAFEGKEDNDFDICYRRKDGSVLWAATFISPVRDESGDIVQHFASFVDLTRQKKEDLQSAMLIDELNHRVKNTLATVQSIVSQVLRMDSDPAVIRESIESRLLALSRSHDLLTRENWKSAGLLDLVNGALEPFGVANGRMGRFMIAGKNIRLRPKATLALGIAFHELATNAVKYGALSNGAGSVRIGWTTEPKPTGDRLILHWEEKGGPSVIPPSRKGFGSRVMEHGLAQELEGAVDLEYRVEGVVCTMNFPAPHDDRDE